jgi:hypothetical protein
MFGAFLCVAVMFISAWYFALLAIFIGIAVYKYIEYAGSHSFSPCPFILSSFQSREGMG